MMQRLAMTAVFTIAAIAAIGVSACQNNGPGAAQDSIVEAGSVATDDVYESPGAPNVVPVDVKYRLLDTPAVGQPLRIELTLVSPLATGGLGYTLEAEEGLSIDAALQKRSYAGKPARTPELSIVSITPQTEGRFYLRVLANVIAGGNSMTRVVTIPIQIGQGTRETETLGEIKTDAEGNPVVSLPAEIKDRD